MFELQQHPAVLFFLEQTMSAVAVTMYSVRGLRDFINDRLSAAAVEIFTVVEQTIVQYQEEVDRHRKKLDIAEKTPQNILRIDIPQQDVYETEQFYNHERTSSFHQKEPDTPQTLENQEELEAFQIKEEEEEPELPRIKEEEEDLYTTQEIEQFVLKQETGAFIETCTQNPSGPDIVNLQSYTASGSSRTADMLRSQCEPNSKSYLNCNICGKGFKFYSQVRVHQRIHTGEKPHPCQVCGKRFVQKQHLKNHMKIHTGEKPYSCQTCGRSFSDQGNYMVHLRTHTGEKPYSCSICNKRFSKSSALKCHIIIHTGEKPHICQICGKRFIQKQHLKKHTIIHTGLKPHSCEVCGKSFTQQSTLVRHKRTHNVDTLQ